MLPLISNTIMLALSHNIIMLALSVNNFIVNYIVFTNMKRIYTLRKYNKVQFTYNTRQSQFMSLGGQLVLQIGRFH